MNINKYKEKLLREKNKLTAIEEYTNGKERVQL